MRSWALCRGKISPRCVPGRQSVAIFSLHASRKWLRTRKRGLRGKIRAPCIQNELALARCARHVSEKPRKPPSEDTPREYLARKGPFSLHGPLESCIVRRSCHPPRLRTAPAPATLPAPNRPSARSPLRCRTARAIATTAPPLWRGSLPRGWQNRTRAASCRAGWRRQRSAWRCGGVERWRQSRHQRSFTCESLTPIIPPNLESWHSRGGFRAGRRQGGVGQAVPPSRARALATFSSAFKEKVNPLVLFCVDNTPRGYIVAA